MHILTSNIIFASNPCKYDIWKINIFSSNRIKLGKNLKNDKFPLREILIVKNDILEKSCCNAYHMPENLNDIPLQVLILLFNLFQFSKFYLSQNHISPLSFNEIPIVWSMDSKLFLYPKPNIVIFFNIFV